MLLLTLFFRHFPKLIDAGHVFVASVAIGAQDAHTVRVLRAAEAYPGPSLVIAYSPCIAHGYDLVFGADQQKRAVQSGVASR